MKNILECFNHKGLCKHWIYQNNHNYELSCGYLEKMNYSLQDFEYAVNNLEHRGNIIYVIVLITWLIDILESFIRLPDNDDNHIVTILHHACLENFDYDEDAYLKVKKYVAAIRSFTEAHPLNTSRHKRFGLDGTYWSVDINNELPKIVVLRNDNYKHINLEGICNCDVNEDMSNKIFVTTYTAKGVHSKYPMYISLSVDDLKYCVNTCINIMTKLDIHLSKLKKKDIKNNK